MTGWLTLTDDERRTTLEQASVRSGMEPKAVEKAWWVTLCLKALFNTKPIKGAFELRPKYSMCEDYFIDLVI
jgi:hypothetical protein